MLKQRFMILEIGLGHTLLETSQKIIRAAGCLHNLSLHLSDPTPPEPELEEVNYFVYRLQMVQFERLRSCPVSSILRVGRIPVYSLLALRGNKNGLPCLNGLLMVHFECPRHGNLAVSSIFRIGRIPLG